MSPSYLNTYYCYKIVNLLATPFSKTDAYKLGVIDEVGHILVPKSKRTQAQKDAMGPFEVLIFNLKKIMARLGVKTSLGSVAVSAWLLTEEIKKHGEPADWLEQHLTEEYGLRVQSSTGHIEPGFYVAAGFPVLVRENLVPTSNMLGQAIFLIDGLPFAKDEFVKTEPFKFYSGLNEGVVVVEDEKELNDRIVRLLKALGMLEPGKEENAIETIDRVPGQNFQRKMDLLKSLDAMEKAKINESTFYKGRSFRVFSECVRAMLNEDAPANNAGSGLGTGIDPKNPPVFKPVPFLRRKKPK